MITKATLEGLSSTRVTTTTNVTTASTTSTLLDR